MPGLSELQVRLEYAFHDENLLRLALTHPSVAHESTGNIPHNQRLEFLGDAVLSLVITLELYEKFPDLGEGPLTKARAQMVNRRALASEARRLGLGEHLILSRGEEISGGRERISALADAFEAVIGAIFLDGGYEAACRLVLVRFRSAFGELSEVPNLENPKGELQELLQARSPEAPQYELTSVSGPDHNREFECAVFHHGMELGRGRGKSKKAAESQAALAALAALRTPLEESPSDSPREPEHPLTPSLSPTGGENSPKNSRIDPPTLPLPSLSSPAEGEERVAAGRESSGFGEVHGEGAQSVDEGDAARFKVPLRGDQTAEASHEAESVMPEGPG